MGVENAPGSPCAWETERDKGTQGEEVGKFTWDDLGGIWDSGADKDGNKLGNPSF